MNNKISKKTDQIVANDIKEDDFVVPQLTTEWANAKKIVGIDNSEFLSDFLLIQNSKGIWHCIGIGGQGHIQDSFFHAVGDKLTEHFTYIERVYSGRKDTEWMWAPYAVYDKGGSAYMYFLHKTLNGGTEMRMHNAVDDSLNKWQPLNHPDLNNGNIAFLETSARDACVFFDENVGKYLMYYSGTLNAGSVINVRSSDDLINWSKATKVMGVPKGFQAAESPFVQRKNGYYYLFVSGFDYGRVAVYASKDPYNFGHPDNDKLGEINGHAPEIVTVEGKDYIACAAISTKGGGAPAYTDLSGVYIQELKWVKPQDATWFIVPQKTEMEPFYKGYWGFENNFNEKLSGLHSDSDISDIKFIDGIKGKAVEFSGNKSIDIDYTGLSLSENFTISYWMKIKAESTPDRFNVLFAKGYKEGGHFELYVHPNGAICFYQFELGIHDTKAIVNDGKWHHIAVTYDTKDLIIYVDSKQIYNASVKIKPAVTTAKITFGSLVEKINFFTGAMDELYILDKALSESEIIGIMNDGYDF